ncbi:hypothetical protein [Cupriavidus metallidurans]
MSKRFGRNQRRRAREALAQANTQISGLEAARQSDARTMEYMRADREQARDTMKFIARELGQHFVGLPAMLNGGYKDDRRPLEWPWTPPMGLPKLLTSVGDGTASPHACAYFEYLLMDLLTVEAVRHHLSRKVHFVLRKNGEHQHAYAVSAQTLASYDKDYLVRVVSKGLAHLVAEQMSQAT